MLDREPHEKSQPTHVERRRITALERRLKHLQTRIESTGDNQRSTYDRQEAGALEWAIELLKQHCSGFNQRVIRKVDKVRRDGNREAS